MTRAAAGLLASILLGLAAAPAAEPAAAPVDRSDWQQFLGPDRNGAYGGSDAAGPWRPEGPPIRWTRKVGQGFSGPAVADGKLIIFHRLGDRETVECLDAELGRPLWSFDYPTAYHDDFGFDEGPRATPAIAAGRVYTFGAEGLLHSVDLETGKKAWSADTRALFQPRKGFFGAACSPLVAGGKVFLNPGGKGAGIVAFDARSGEVAWKAADDEASYSSPVAASIGGVSHILFLTRAGLTDADPETGAVHFHFPWTARNRNSVNAATPLVSGDRVFISASYDTGAALLKVTQAGKGWSAEKVWASDEALSCHYATSVLHQGTLYGFHGRQEWGMSFRAVDLETGKVLWSKDKFSAGTVTLAGGKLLILTEGGDLVRAPASPEGFREEARAKILTGTVRAHPALARGRLYARNEDTFACADLRG